MKQRMATTLKTISTLPSVASVTSPYEAKGARQISADKTTAYATVIFTETIKVPNPDVKRVVDTAEAARTSGLQVELGGNTIQQEQQAAAEQQ